MKVSVIFTTYNQPAALEKVLLGFTVQTYRDFEIIVADDGSRADTKDLIGRIADHTEIPIKHVWHEDQGFQKCLILNKAILESSSEYLIFTDGDCIPHKDFVANHVKLAEKNHFLSGGYFKLSAELTKRITNDDVLSGRATDRKWLAAQGQGRFFKRLKIGLPFGLANLLNLVTPTRPSWNGHSASTWKDLIIQTRGFDERMQYGGQDREFGERLENMGIKGKQARYHCTSVHLDHPRSYATQESRDKNRRIRNETRDQKLCLTEHSIIHDALD